MLLQSNFLLLTPSFDKYSNEYSVQALLRALPVLSVSVLWSQVPAAAEAWGQPHDSPAAGEGSLEHRAGWAGAAGIYSMSQALVNSQNSACQSLQAHRIVHTKADFG